MFTQLYRVSDDNNDYVTQFSWGLPSFTQFRIRLLLFWTLPSSNRVPFRFVNFVCGIQLGALIPSRSLLANVNRDIERERERESNEKKNEKTYEKTAKGNLR